MTARLEAENAQLRARLATLASLASTEGARLSSTLDRIEAGTNDTPTTGRATCRMHTTRGRRCTAEPLDTDPKAIQICARHAAEVMQLINEKRKNR